MSDLVSIFANNQFAITKIELGEIRVLLSDQKYFKVVSSRWFKAVFVVFCPSRVYSEVIPLFLLGCVEFIQEMST